MKKHWVQDRIKVDLDDEDAHGAVGMMMRMVTTEGNVDAVEAKIGGTSVTTAIGVLQMSSR